MLSINTNPVVHSGIRGLNETTRALGQTGVRISTGLKVNRPQDDAATLAIAQRLLGDIGAATSVKIGLDSAQATIGVAAVGAANISDLLVDMKSIAVQASQENIDAESRQALNSEFNALRDQIGSVVSSSEFNGTNLIEPGAADLNVLKDADGGRINVSAQDFSAAGLGIDTAALDTAANAQSALSAIETALSQATSQQADLGSSAKRIESQQDFTVQLRDIQQEGVGNLIDADLGTVSAALQAGRVKQQLGLQALSIANSSPKHILSLFQG